VDSEENYLFGRNSYSWRSFFVTIASKVKYSLTIRPAARKGYGSKKKKAIIKLANASQRKVFFWE